MLALIYVRYFRTDPTMNFWHEAHSMLPTTTNRLMNLKNQLKVLAFFNRIKNLARQTIARRGQKIYQVTICSVF